jgi:nucleoid DNA-binding protein/DNA-directed RNA polymerase subunit RPC12/RpoP
MTPTATYSKSRLIKELAFMAGIPQVKSRAVLEALRTIISREAASAPFILPGICKFDTAMRKERRIRNPRTGEALVLPAHKVVRLTPSKSLRQAVAPRVAAVKASTLIAEQKVESPNSLVPSPETEHPVEKVAAVPPVTPPPVTPSPVAPPPVAPAPASPAPTAPVAEPAPVKPAPAEPAPAVPPPPVESQVESPSNDATVQRPNDPATQRTEKVAAADDFILPDLIPNESKSSTPEPAASAEPPAPAEPEFTVAPNGDITFHCKRCGQEIEAPADMAGTDAECPMCGTPIHVPTPSGHASVATVQSQEVVSASVAETIDPSALKNKTIRIDATELGFDDPAPAAKEAPVGDASGMLSFFCPGCHQEIEAPADMAGTSSECPNCGTEFVVPFFSEKGTVHANKEELFDPRKAHDQKHKTMRIDLDDF